MPVSAPAALLRVVLKLIVIGFAGLFMGFLLSPRTSPGKDAEAQRISQVEAFRTTIAEAPTPSPTPEIGPRTLTALDVRIGPSTNYQVIGSVARGAKLDVIGRDQSGQWLAVAFAGGTKINGWVPAQSISGVANLASLPLAPVTLLPR